MGKYDVCCGVIYSFPGTGSSRGPGDPYTGVRAPTDGLDVRQAHQDMQIAFYVQGVCLLQKVI